MIPLYDSMRYLGKLTAVLDIRLVASWLNVDLDISLFHDTTPKLSITNLNAALPDLDTLWHSRSAEEWARAWETIYFSLDFNLHSNPPSLRETFQKFVNREAWILKFDFSPTQLRLFLHPLQALICNLHQCLNCFSDSGNNRQSQQRLMTQLEEVQSLLQQWYVLCSRSIQKSEAFDLNTSVNLIAYHLISLNTITSFPDIERLARDEMQQADFKQSFWARVRCVDEAPQIWFHCGQVLRLVRAIPESNKPLWCPMAIYRVALIIWATSIANANVQSPSESINAVVAMGSSEDTFMIDGLKPEHTSIVRYLRYQEGVPVLSNKDGGLVSLKIPENLLRHCLEVLSEEESTTRLKNGIKSRIERLIRRVQR